MITADQVKAMRDLTGVSVMQVKKALEEAGGDRGKALLLLKKKSRGIAEKKAGRTLGAGTIAAYVHGNGLVGALVELQSETDFVAKNEEFKKLAYDLAMQVAATNPEYVRAESIDEGARKAVREMFIKEADGLNKDASMKEKIIQGKADSYFKDRILLEQPFIKDETILVKDLIDKYIQKFGERVELSRFSRFSI